MELSQRLKMVADMVEKCDFIVDVGTDHGYLPIYLLQNGKINRAVASDISKGSCRKAEINIRAHGLDDSIEVRCGSGLTVMGDKEMPDCIVMSGMGGMLAIEVLKSNPLGSRAKRLVLQVQRDIYALRKHLHKTGYKIVSEKILKEGGKVYAAMAAEKGEDVPYTETEYHFGRLLLKEKSPVLKEYIAHENNKIKKVLAALKDIHTEEAAERMAQLEKTEKIQKEAMKCM